MIRGPRTNPKQRWQIGHSESGLFGPAPSKRGATYSTVMPIKIAPVIVTTKAAMASRRHGRRAQGSTRPCLRAKPKSPGNQAPRFLRKLAEPSPLGSPGKSAGKVCYGRVHALWYPGEARLPSLLGGRPTLTGPCRRRQHRPKRRPAVRQRSRRSCLSQTPQETLRAFLYLRHAPRRMRKSRCPRLHKRGRENGLNHSWRHCSSR